MIQITLTHITSILILTSLIYSHSLINTQHINHAPQIFYATEFFPATLRVLRNHSTFVMEGEVGRVLLYRDKVVKSTYWGYQVEVRVGSEFVIDEYRPDVEIRVRCRDEENQEEQNELIFVILVTKSMLQQPNSIIGVLNPYRKEQLRVNLNNVKGLTQRQFRGYWFQHNNTLTLLKPQVLIISNKQYTKLTKLLAASKSFQEIEASTQPKQPKEWKWSKVKNIHAEPQQL